MNYTKIAVSVSIWIIQNIFVIIGLNCNSVLCALCSWVIEATCLLIKCEWNIEMDEWECLCIVCRCPHLLFFFRTSPQVLNSKLYIVYVLYNIRRKVCDVEVLMVVTIKIHVFWGLFMCPTGGGTGSNNSEYIPTLGHIPEDSNLQWRHVSCVF